MPGSTLNACPGTSGVRLPGDDVRILVGLGADAVTGAVHEVLAVAGVVDHGARRGVDRLARRADGRGLHPGLLRGDEHVVRVAHLGIDVADDEHAGDVGAVAVHGAAEVAQHDVAALDHAVGRIVVRAGRVGAGGDDGEVGALVPAVEHALDQLAVDVELGATGERARRA